MKVPREITPNLRFYPIRLDWKVFGWPFVMIPFSVTFYTSHHPSVYRISPATVLQCFVKSVKFRSSGNFEMARDEKSWHCFRVFQSWVRSEQSFEFRINSRRVLLLATNHFQLIVNDMFSLKIYGYRKFKCNKVHIL